MEAIRVEAFGDASRSTSVEINDPLPASGEVVVTISAGGVGYVDVMAREGRYLFPEPGFIPGLEIAGTVEATGDGVDSALAGRRVLAFSSRGGYAERVAVRAAGVFPLPDGVSADAAVSVGVNGLVAAFSVDRAAVAAGERVLVRGAGGGIGLMATQLAAMAGGEATATTSSDDRGRRLTKLGAASLWNRRGDAPLPKNGFDVIIDTVGGPETPAFVGLLRANGRYALCGSLEGAPPANLTEAMMAPYHECRP